jgi:L-alanine-DL-glutamate epimerase-like enolase superfamily enzyme
MRFDPSEARTADLLDRGATVKITRIALHQVDLPYVHGTYRLSGGRTYTSFQAAIVRITCDDGTEGWLWPV